MWWLTKLLVRDRNQAKRLEQAQAQQADAAVTLEEARELGRRIRKHERDGFTERIAAAYERRERHA
jgi:hypothetical protein